MEVDINVKVQCVDRKAKSYEASHAVMVYVNGIPLLAALVADKTYAEARAAEIERRIAEGGKP